MPPRVLGHPRDLNASVAVYSETSNFVTAKINDLATPKNMGSDFHYQRWSDGIVGPRKVVQAEVINGRNWEEVVSKSGVTSYVSYLARRALQS
jgi:hypothetical protein